jgi:hypothetical protein
LTAIAQEYVKDPDRTLVVSPDHESRHDLNHLIHQWRQQTGHVDYRAHQARAP